jgi:hypothetical protein
MNRQQLEHTSNDTWTWIRAETKHVEDIVKLAESHYQQEVEQLLTPNTTRLSYHLYKAILEQIYHPHNTMVSVAIDNSTGRVLAWAWLERGKFTPYANEELAVGEFIHTQLDLSLRTRMRLVGQTLDQWIGWCQANAIPVLCSTSIRDDQSGFMRLHDLYGFTRKGSFAYLRTTTLK